MSDKELASQSKIKEIRDRIEKLKHLSDDYAVETRQALEEELAVLEGAVPSTPTQQPVANEQIMEKTSRENQKAEAEDNKTPTDEITYTPMLSKFFPSFSGTCTKIDFVIACESAKTYGIFLGVYLAFVGSLFALFSSDNVYLLITLLLLPSVSYCLFCINNVLPHVVRRLHSFGMNFTCWIVIPNIAKLVLLVCYISGSYEVRWLTGLLIVALLIYDASIIGRCYGDSPEDEKRKKTVLGVSGMKKGKKITSLKKQQTNQTQKIARIAKQKQPTV